MDQAGSNICKKHLPTSQEVLEVANGQAKRAGIGWLDTLGEPGRKWGSSTQAHGENEKLGR